MQIYGINNQLFVNPKNQIFGSSYRSKEIIDFTARAPFNSKEIEEIRELAKNIMNSPIADLQTINSLLSKISNYTFYIEKLSDNEITSIIEYMEHLLPKSEIAIREIIENPSNSDAYGSIYENYARTESIYRHLSMNIKDAISNSYLSDIYNGFESQNKELSNLRTYPKVKLEEAIEESVKRIEEINIADLPTINSVLLKIQIFSESKLSFDEKCRVYKLMDVLFNKSAVAGMDAVKSHSSPNSYFATFENYSLMKKICKNIGMNFEFFLEKMAEG